MTRSRTKFVCDAMLGSLARKLRAFGFDASYYKEGSDAGILEASVAGGRIILTSDRRLAARALSKGVAALLIEGGTEGRRVRALVRAAKESGFALERGDPLCSVCGGELEAKTRAEVVPLVPKSVAVRHRRFFRCASCGRVYWKGSHWKKLSGLERVFPTAHRMTE